MLVIRLSRMGKKKKPMYRLTIMEKARDTYGRALEILGSYNPFSKELIVKADRIKYWLSVGAQMSPTVNNLLVQNKIIEAKKVTASKKGTPKKGSEEEKKAATPAPAKPKEKPVKEIKEEKSAEKPTEKETPKDK